jgi:hypothetical protein
MCRAQECAVGGTDAKGGNNERRKEVCTMRKMKKEYGTIFFFKYQPLDLFLPHVINLYNGKE